MRRTGSYFKAILISRAIWNFWVAAVLGGGGLSAALDWAGLFPARPAMWPVVAGGFIGGSGMLSILASRGLVDYRPVLYMDIGGRSWYIGLCVYFQALGYGHWLLWMIASIDLVMILLGIDFLRHYLAHTASAGDRVREARRAGTG
jgi:hypothetical protein